MEKKKILLSVKDLHVKFRIGGRILTAIRGISLDFYENESVAIVGESGSGKSVFTKTVAGMLDTNGYIDEGSIIFHDEELVEVALQLDALGKRLIGEILKMLNRYSRLEAGAFCSRQLLELEADKREKFCHCEQAREITDRICELADNRAELLNRKQTVDRSKEKDCYEEVSARIKSLDAEIKALKKQKAAAIAEHKKQVRADTDFQNYYTEKKAVLNAEREKLIRQEISEETAARNAVIAREIYLSVGRYDLFHRLMRICKLLSAMKKAMTRGTDLNDEAARKAVFDEVAFRVKYEGEEGDTLRGSCALNRAQIRNAADWIKIHGGKIATIYRDPMTSLNPLMTIGKQITAAILEHENCSKPEAGARVLELMKKVGISEAHFDDYPFQLSGGMRQRLAIAIALSSRPRILICDEPTAALDVTAQSQILKLLKDLQKEFGYSVVFITHDLGVAANIADRVAVLYAGQLVEVGTAEEVFYDPRHPYTWALLSCLPQLAQGNTKLQFINGTPPIPYNKIVGDAFAPRNPYCMKIDTLEEPPMFRITDTHFAKTWLLDPRAPQVEKPEIIQNTHEKLTDVFNI